MTNEEYTEELLYNVHKSGVFVEFMVRVEKESTIEPKKPIFDIREEIYYNMLKQGLIRVSHQ
ncbi:hypothetical protein OAB94_02945 [Flavobacteriaceae bacterium]|nr:hypothetical protein [bacterium]MDB4277662.1 hypothetical protein [Gammaproteobacteria bacterium]MDB4352783.1 hypothetical protein [Porticoccaceae bacterium]MDB9801316.1 hypothetical protein [Flavobacteriaceae bacterium]